MKPSRHFGWLICSVLATQLSCGLLDTAVTMEVDVPPTTTVASPTYTPTIVAPAGSLPSPDGNYFAIVRDDTRLIIRGAQGSETEIADGEEVTHLAWFPDSQHLIYAERMRSESDLPGYVYRLNIVNISSGASSQINDGLAPSISPDGRRVAFILGGGYGDACLTRRELEIVELDNEKRPISYTIQSEIEGMPLSEPGHTFGPRMTHDRSFPGSWQNETTLEVAMAWACLGPEDGIYEINLQRNEAKKIADLPSP